MAHVAPTNFYLSSPMGPLFIRTAAPIILIMTISGLYAVADAYFLGLYVGPEALSAVTLIFPIMMMIYALQTLVSNGMASIVARRLGAGERPAAEATFSGAHFLSAVVVAILWVIYLGAGPSSIVAAAGDETVASMAQAFLGITVATAPIAFFLTLNIDALRCEGRLGLMAGVTVAATVLNIAMNWVFLGALGWGVAGSATATALAQLACLLVVVGLRFGRPGMMRLRPTLDLPRWGRMLALGAPTSLGLLGISLVSASIIFNLRLWQQDDYVATIAAYGIITRILTFAYLPLMGVNIAFQTICGNNYGAGLRARTNLSLVIALATAVIYCSLVEIIVFLLSGRLGAAFVDDPAVIAETARILPYTIAAYALFGIPLVLSGYFQAIGEAARAGLFGLSRVYLFSIPLIFALPHVFGATGIWMAAPLAEVLMFTLIIAALALGQRRTGWRMGLLQPV